MKRIRFQELKKHARTYEIAACERLFLSQAAKCAENTDVLQAESPEHVKNLRACELYTRTPFAPAKILRSCKHFEAPYLASAPIFDSVPARFDILFGIARFLQDAAGRNSP